MDGWVCCLNDKKSGHITQYATLSRGSFKVHNLNVLPNNNIYDIYLYDLV